MLALLAAPALAPPRAVQDPLEVQVLEPAGTSFTWVGPVIWGRMHAVEVVAELHELDYELDVSAEATAHLIEL